MLINSRLPNSYTEFHENLTNGVAADTRSWSDGLMDGDRLHISRYFLLRKSALKTSTSVP